MSYIEYSNAEIVDKCCNLSLDDFIELLSESERYEKILEKDNNEDNDLKNSFFNLIRYCKESKKNNYQVNVSYKKGINQLEGRDYAIGLGLQKINREFRGCLVKDLLLDFDMVNCHPVILLYYCKKHNLNCYNLEYYCKNRESILNQFIESDDLKKGECKILFIKSLNTEYKVKKDPYSKRNKNIKYDFFIKFDNEIKEIQNNLIEKEKDIYNKITDNNNKKGKFISYLCRLKESQILDKVEQKIKMDVKMYDGFMIHKDKVENVNEFINQLNEETKEENIKWSMKSNDITLYDSILENTSTSDFLNICELSLQDISNALFNIKYKDKLTYCNNVLHYKYKQGWINKEKEIERIIINDLTKNYLYIEDVKNDKYIKICKLVEYKEIIDFLKIKSKINNNLLDEIRSFTLQKIFFNNGYYDSKLHTFIYTKDLNTIKRIDRNFIKGNYKKEIKEIYDRILNPIFTIKDNNKDRIQLRDNYLYYLSRCIFGYYQDKTWSSLEGNRNCGKGVLTDLIQSTFGNYILQSNAENFLSNKFNNNDKAKANSYLVDYIGTRLIIANEIQINPDGSTVLDGNKIKSLCSGGDRICGRKNFQDEMYFNLECGLMFFCNDLPDVKPTDAKERQLHYNLNSIFVDDETYEKNKDKEGFKYYKQDHSLKDELIKNERYQMAFMYIMMDSLKHKVEYPKIEKIVYEEDNESDLDKLYSLFNFHSSDTILLKDIYTRTINNNINFTAKKIKKILMNHKNIKFKKTNQGQTAVNLSFIDTDEGNE